MLNGIGFKLGIVFMTVCVGGGVHADYIKKKKPAPPAKKTLPPAATPAKTAPAPAKVDPAQAAKAKKEAAKAKKEAAKAKKEAAEKARQGKLREQAGQYYLEGRDLYVKELYNAAIKAFRKSYSIFPMEVTVYNIAKSYEKLGVSSECILWFERYIGLYRKKNKKDPPDILDINNAMSKCRLGLELKVTIESEPKGAFVYIDSEDKLTGQTPITTKLKPGTHTITLRSKGYENYKKKVQVRRGESRRLFLKMEKIRISGKITITTNIRGASIFVDGRNIGRTPYKEAITLPEGRHQIAVEKDEYEAVTRTIDVNANQTQNVDASLFLKDSPTTWKKGVGWTAFTLGTLLLAGGFGAGYYADTLFQGTEDFILYAKLQKVGYIGGGILAGVGVTLLIWESIGRKTIKAKDRLSRFDSTLKPSISPVWSISPNGGFVGAHVRF
jgi:tetratricopeptide (TPR) repeat protein